MLWAVGARFSDWSQLHIAKGDAQPLFAVSMIEAHSLPKLNFKSRINGLGVAIQHGLERRV